jgi:hypothetical protein
VRCNSYHKMVGTVWDASHNSLMSKCNLDMSRHLISHTKGRTQMEGVQEQGSEENKCTQDI